jgi:hypothetical protein
VNPIHAIRRPLASLRAGERPDGVRHRRIRHESTLLWPAPSPGWQLTLMALTVVLLAAALIAIAYPGPGGEDSTARRGLPQGGEIVSEYSNIWINCATTRPSFRRVGY